MSRSGGRRKTLDDIEADGRRFWEELGSLGGGDGYVGATVVVVSAIDVSLRSLHRAERI